MNEMPRVATEREIFESIFLTRWKVCLDMAINELRKRSEEIDINFTMQDVLSATAQLFIQWSQYQGYIEHEKDKVNK